MDTYQIVNVWQENKNDFVLGNVTDLLWKSIAINYPTQLSKKFITKFYEDVNASKDLKLFNEKFSVQNMSNFLGVDAQSIQWMESWFLKDIIKKDVNVKIKKF